MTPIKIDNSPRFVTKLCVPASSEKMVKKALGLTVDQIILDLEDSVLDSDKAVARKNIAEITDVKSKSVAVRVNATDTPHFEADLTFLQSHSDLYDHIILPKVDSLEMLDHYLTLLPANKSLEIQIETASALLNVVHIAQSPRIQALSFGPLDFLASVGVPVVSSNLWGAEIHELLRYALMQIIIAGHANHKYVYDGPTVILDDEALRVSATTARNLGADGKWLIHPNQIDTCTEIFNEEFSNDLNLAEMRSGSERIAGQMVDMASLRIAKNKEN